MNTIDFSKMFPDNRHEGETVLRQAQLVMLRMLKIIDYICRKHDIKYWMCSGTLLGAVRHKGFIPWDDDIDICMLREDYERFIQIGIDELPNDMLLQTRETDANYKYLPLPCKVRDKKSYILSPGFEDENTEKGLYLDVFPFDRFHKNYFIFGWERLIKKYNTLISKCLDSVYFKDESKIRNFLSYFNPLFHSLVVKYMAYAKKMIDQNRKLEKDYYIGHGFDTLWKRYFNYDDIFPLVELEFEGKYFFAPHLPHIYLIELYGANYMIPPPEVKRKQHAHMLKPIL